MDLAKAAARLLAVKRARDSLYEYIRLMMPHPLDVEDARMSFYEDTPQARLLCEVMEKVARGELRRVAISIPPQHGKSTVISEAFPGWIAGRTPWVDLILGTYSQDFAEEWGGKVRSQMTSSAYAQIFPKTILRKGDKAKARLVTEQKGRLSFVGRGGQTTGKPADIFICDDPIKDKQEADSPTILQQVYSWLTSVVHTRCHSESAIVIVHTRWNQDDPIGRLCDPDHPDHDPQIAKDWTYINIPAVLREKDKELVSALGLTLEPPTNPRIAAQFGAGPVTALWERRKSLAFLAEAKQLDPAVFSALYMGSPAPEDGDYFKLQDLIGYRPEELPLNLRMYCASDHALSSKENTRRDASCFGTMGIDERGIMWLLPDLYWERESNAMKLVEEIVAMMQRQKPQIWWAEREHISKSIGPFLRKRMVEEAALSTLLDDSLKSVVDLQSRARSIQGMISLHRVRFPTFASWWPEAKAQMLRFPNAAHDDFVSMLSLFGRGLQREIRAHAPAPKDNVIRVGSMRWIKARAEAERRERERYAFARGM